MQKTEALHGLAFAFLAFILLFILHHLPINQIFIDPFTEAIKNHDLMDISISKFRNHKNPYLFDNQVVIINSEVTNRKEIAEAINYLSQQNVRGIGVDLVFDSLHLSKADTLLAAALGNEKVILGYTFKEAHDASGNSTMGMRSDNYFTSKATLAYVNLASNDGFSVRAFEPFHVIDGKEQHSFSLKLASTLDSTVVRDTRSRGNKLEWINFKRVQPGEISMQYPINSHGLSHYAFYGIKNFLRDTASYPAKYFEDKIVLIGFCGESDKAMSMKDRYFTPLNEKYQGRSLPDMHGVVVHANIVSMLAKREFIYEVPELLLYTFAFVIFFVNYLIFAKVARRKLYLMVPVVRLIQVFQFIFLFTLCIFFLAYADIKIGFIIIMTAVILSFDIFEFYAHKMRNRVAQRINRILHKEKKHDLPIPETEEINQHDIPH